ncbi:hypothetical protein ACFY5C_37810 [Streptomyces sp. NPDC012935]|uniref:hypothetical protein n=1 Tax=Streptomyces sp. NPDC012935 TaxID=3364857 RepID=UPI0036AF5C5C
MSLRVLVPDFTQPIEVPGLLDTDGQRPWVEDPWLADRPQPLHLCVEPPHHGVA